MDKNTLNRAKELNLEIEKLNRSISDIKYHHIHARKNKIRETFVWMIRVFNKKQDENKEPKMFLFDNCDVQGSDIPIDEELLILIKEYFESKVKEKEEQFNNLT